MDNLEKLVLRANGLNSKSEFGRIPGARSWFGHDLVMNILQKINCSDNIGLKSLDSAFAIWMTFLEKKTIIFGSSFDVIFEFCALTAQEMPDVDEETQRNIAAVRMLMSLTCVKTGDLHEQNLNRTWSDSWNQIRWGQMFRIGTSCHLGGEALWMLTSLEQEFVVFWEDHEETVWTTTRNLQL